MLPSTVGARRPSLLPYRHLPVGSRTSCTQRKALATVGEGNSSQTCKGGLVKIMNLSYDRCAGEKTPSELRQQAALATWLVYVLDL